MSSIWSSQGTQEGISPWGGSALAPVPGGGAAARAQLGGRSPGTSTQPGLSPGAARGASATASPAGAAGSGSTSAGTGTTITSNDFLSLLVTEMQNQDPTADTDPNEYINQLVQINSLEQLISINQNLAEVLGAASSTPTGSAGPAAVGHSPASARPQAAVQTATSPGAGRTRNGTQGNLSAPASNPAAHTVARALDGRSRGPGHGHGIRDIPTH